MEDKHLTAEQRAARGKSIQQLAAEIIALAGHLNESNERLLELIAQLDREKSAPPPRDSQRK